ncbi:MAG: hypothetical protein JSS72_12920 [Armatimonadetes bacterium]|nr:hypothetical protein [Armatimonadota bacterium]
MILLSHFQQTPISYILPQDHAVPYEVKIQCDGYIPILGGQEGTVAVTMGVKAQGLPKDSDGNEQASIDLTALKVVFNGADLPFNAENARPYFPKTTVSLTPEGKVTKNNAPNVNLPVKLPGLDPRRFPEITFVPVEFPVGGVSEGQEWTYKKAFGDTDVTYKLKATKVSNNSVTVEIKLAQEYDVIEDDSHNLAMDPKDKAYDVHTVLNGTGEASFDRKLNLVSLVSMEAVANSTVVDIKSKESTSRKMTTHITTRIADAATVAADEPKGDWVQTAKLYGKIAVQKASQWASRSWSELTHWLVAMFGFAGN